MARRAALLGLLGLGLAADAQAASNPFVQKKDPYTVREPLLAACSSTVDTAQCSWWLGWPVKMCATEL